MEITTDVRTLLRNDELINSIAPAAFRDYNTEQMIVVDSPKGKVLISKFGEVSPSEYLDHANNQVVTYDHIKQAVTGSRGIGGEVDGDVEPFRKAFEAEAIKYQQEFFPNGAAAAFSAKDGSSHVVHICVTAAIFNAKNYYGGRWRSHWTAKFKPGSGNATLEGQLKIQVHYYEEGNVQLNTDTKKTKSIPVADPAALAAAAFKAIAAIEGDFHVALDKSYTTMGNTTFKALRRALPITRKKIEWEKIMQYKVGAAMGN
jgi:capping protein alpha